MPRWTEDELRAYEQRYPNLVKIGEHSRTKLQKHEVDLPQQAGKAIHCDKAGKESVDGGDHPVFRVSVTIRCSDNYARDGDGMYSTLIDCVIAAARRLKILDTAAQRCMSERAERAGGV